MNKCPSLTSLVIAIGFVAIVASTAIAQDLEIRWRWKTGWGSTESGRRAEQLSTTVLPRDLVRVFVHEGTPLGVKINQDTIAVSYERSGVLFDRATGEPIQRFTMADGWPRRPDAFINPDAFRKPHMVGVGVAHMYYPWTASDHGNGGDDEPVIPDEIVAQTQFGGQTWQARQPPKFLRSVKHPAAPLDSVTWSSILSRLNEASYLEAIPAGAGKPKRFSTTEGLAGNIVTNLAACDGVLWAACVDIFNPKTEQWETGGLSRYDEKTQTWKRVEKIDGRPVRWVTLLQEINGEIWVGFREGSSVFDDRVGFGKGLYPSVYRPKASAIVLARLKDGQWTTFSRAPRPENPRSKIDPDVASAPSTEFPETLTRQGDNVLLFTRMDASQPTGNWNRPKKGQVSLLNIESGKWLDYDTLKDIDADQLYAITCDDGEAIVTSNRGLHRFDWKNKSWTQLDSKCDLKNPVFHAGAIVNDELWLGYGRQSYRIYGQQGISRFSEKTGKWSFMSSAELKTGRPVRRIVADANGEAWVLFNKWPYWGQAFDYIHPEAIHHPTGLGRFANGKWEFPSGPVKPDKSQQHFGNHPNGDLVAVGDKLLFLYAYNLYEGPSPWRKIESANILGLRQSKDGKTVEILRRSDSQLPEGEKQKHEVGNWNEQKYELGTYSPERGISDWKELPEMKGWGSTQIFETGPLLPGSRVSSGKHWVTLSEANGGVWILTSEESLRNNSKSIIKTPTAIWLFSEGEVIRLDRKRVEDLIKKASEKLEQ